MLRRRAGDSQPQAKAGSCEKRRRMDGEPGGKSSADFRFAARGGGADGFRELAASGRDACFLRRGALSLVRRYRRLHCLSSGFFVKRQRRAMRERWRKRFVGERAVRASGFRCCRFSGIGCAATGYGRFGVGTRARRERMRRSDLRNGAEGGAMWGGGFFRRASGLNAPSRVRACR